MNGGKVEHAGSPREKVVAKNGESIVWDKM
jgi:hypothetical protein